MPEEEIVDYLDLMLDSIALIEGRFATMNTPDEFVQSMDGMTLPFHANRDISPILLRQIAKDTSLTVEEFISNR